MNRPDQVRDPASSGTHESENHTVGRQPGNHEPAHAEALGFDLPAPAKISKTRLLGIGAIGIAVLGAAFFAGWLPRRHAQKELVTETKTAAAAALRVQVASPKAKSSDRSLALPGSVQPLEETTIYPRANGYVRKWTADIGDKVKEGDVLAEIDTPELDQQLEQARAQLVQAEAGLLQSKANRDFSNTQLERYKQLAPKGVASQQELDKQQAQQQVDEANVKVSEANIAAQQANIRRLTQLKSFARVMAPFSGRINARQVERGNLVSPTTPLFRISAVDPVRVFVQVPQDVAPSVRADVPAQVTVREFAGRVFEGKVARSAGALDPASRTMNTEVRVPNPNGELLAGMFAQVALTLPSPHRVFELPPTAVINDAQGLRLATVDADNKIHLVPIVVERDTGSTVEISSGLTGAERVVKLASAETYEGRPVEILP